MTPPWLLIAVTVTVFLAPVAAESSGHCVWYGECNVDEQGFTQNCEYNGPAKNFTDPDGLKFLRKNCPRLFNSDGEAYTCCDPAQVIALNDNLQKAASVYSRCPVCLRNFYNMFCEFTCSPTQSEFLEVAESKSNDNGKYVTSVNVYIEEETMDKFFQSCKGVIMPQSGKYATDIACGAYDSTTCNRERWYDYMGSGNPFSPFNIYFLTSNGIFEDMTSRSIPMSFCNETTEEGEACSCVDCPLSCPATDNSLYGPPPPPYFSVAGIDIYVLCTTIIYVIVLLITGLCVRRNAKKRLDKSYLDNAKNFTACDTPSKLEEWGYKSEVILEKAFQKIGTVCASQPLIVLFVASWALAAFIYAAPDVELISSPVKLWAAPESQSRKEKDYFDSHFTPFYRAEQIFMKAVNLPTIKHEMAQGVVEFGSAFNKEFLLKVLEIQTSLQNLKSDDGEIMLDKICFAPLHNDFIGPITVEKCTIQSIWGYFQNSVEKFNKVGEKNGLETNYLNIIYDCLQNSYDPSCLAPYGGPAENLLVVGAGDVTANNTAVSANTLVMNFVVNNHVNDADNAAAMAWEKKVADYLLEFQANEMPEWMDIAFFLERSVEDEIQKVSETSLGIIVISYGIMLLYVSVALGRFTSWRRIFVDSKIFLGISGVASVGLSVLAAIGIFSYMKYPTILLTLEAVPFLVLAVGVDNLFIMVRCHERVLEQEKNPKAKADPARLGRTLGQAGPSMLLSTLAEEGCFLIGALSPMPAVKSFATLAAVSLAINFLMQVTVLVAVMALDERRHLSRRADVLCCVRSSAPPPSGDNNNLVQRFFERVLAPALMSRWGRVLVPLAFLFVVLAAITFVPHMTLGLEQSLAMTKDSYVFKYFAFMKELLSIGPPVYFVITEGLNYTNPSHQNLVCGGIGCRSDSLATVIQAASKTPELTHMARPASSWIDDLFDWATLDTCCKEFASNGSFCPHERTEPECYSCSVTVEAMRPSAADIRKYVPNFLLDIPDVDCAKGGIASYASGVNFVMDQNGMSDVGASYFMGYHTPVRTSPDYYEAIREARKMAKRVEDKINTELELEQYVKVFPYSIFYVYYEQYLTIASETTISLAMSLTILFVVMTLLNGLDMWASLMVDAIVVMILMDMMAIMYLWGIDLNAISMVNLVVAMGIAVEFNSHIMHAFQKSTQRDRKARAMDALINTGSSVFSGIFLTKFSGIIVLYFAPVQVLEVFYFRMYLSIMVLGALHGLILLPVILSIIGPRANRARIRDNWDASSLLSVSDQSEA